MADLEESATRVPCGSCFPIDVIAANHPIVIMDEPQKMEGDAYDAIYD